MSFEYGLYDESQIYRDAACGLRRLAAIEGVWKAQRAAAETLADLIREDWKRRAAVKESKARVPHWLRLLGERPQAAYLDHWEDHISLWNRDGAPHIYVSQPYWLGTGDLRAIVACCDENELTADVTAELSWHFPGRTTLVAVRRKPKGSRFKDD